MSRRTLDTVFVLSWKWYAAHYDRILADFATLARIQNPRRETTKADVFVLICNCDVVFDFHAIHDLFCNFLRVIRLDAATSTFRN